MADAELLVILADCLTAANQRRMRAELRQSVGTALRVPMKRRDELDCLRNSDVFLTFMPGARLAREDLEDRRPLLRQALVAGCAATETYLADKVMTKVGQLARSSSVSTRRLDEVPLDVKRWLSIEEGYKIRRRGLRELVIEPYVRERASTSPNKIGELMGLVGVRDWHKRVDSTLRVPRGSTVTFLDRVTSRRNRIAHTGDRSGYGRGRLTVAEVEADLDQLRQIVGALEGIIR